MFNVLKVNLIQSMYIINNIKLLSLKYVCTTIINFFKSILLFQKKKKEKMLLRKFINKLKNTNKNWYDTI